MTTTDATTAAQRMARRWQDMGVDLPEGHRGCVPAAQAAIEALAQVGITAAPLPCVAMVFNQPAFTLFMRGIPGLVWPEDHSGRVGPEHAPTRQAWDGEHVVIEHDDWVYAPRLDALARTAGIDLPTSVWAKGTEMWPLAPSLGHLGHWWISYQPDQPVVMLKPAYRFADPRRMPGWCDDLPSSWTDELLDAIHADRIEVRA